MADPLRAAVIGLGVGRNHIEGYQRAGIEVLVVCDLNELRLKNVMAAYDIAKGCRNFDEAIDDADIVSIASYDQDHASHVLGALHAGKHVFVEKPLCLYETTEMSIIKKAWAKVEKKDLKLACNLPLRYHSPFVDLKAKIEHGDFGEIYLIEADYNYGRLAKLRDGWRGNTPGYSVVLGGGIHMVGLAVWLMDEPIVAVQATGNNFHAESFPNHDTVVANVKFRSGALGRMSVNFGYDGRHEHRIRLWGDIYQAECEILNHSSVDKAAAIGPFVEAIRENKRPGILPEELFHVMDVCFAIEKASHDSVLIRVS